MKRTDRTQMRLCLDSIIKTTNELNALALDVEAVASGCENPYLPLVSISLSFALQMCSIAAYQLGHAIESKT